MMRVMVLLLTLATPFAAASQMVDDDGGLGALRARTFGAVPVDPEYRLEFTRCDGDASQGTKRDSFMGHSLVLPGVSSDQQYYLCSRDPSNVETLDRLADGTIHWRSKMALDVDGSWAAWERPGRTDLRETSFKWPDVADRGSREAQLDPDQIPFIVIPIDGLKKLTGADASRLGAMFRDKTGIGMGDLGVAMVANQWTPVMVGDGGPFMRLGEGSARVFEEVGRSRCLKWNAAKTRCDGPGGGRYPYRNAGIDHGVEFYVVPGSRRSDMTAANARAIMCAFARDRFGLTGSTACRDIKL